MSGEQVGLVGVGLMGAEMGRRLLESGIGVTAWDREPEHVDSLCEVGGQRADDPAAAISAGTAVITMLPTADIVLEVLTDALSHWPDGTVWLQMSSVGAAESDRLAAVAADHDITQFDAPVSGSTQVARAGELTVLASGPEDHRDVVTPVLEALGSVHWVGAAGAGSRLKLAVNNWMMGTVAALAETLALCEAMGLDPDHLVALLDGGPLGSPYGVQKLGEMRKGSYPAGFPVRLALKDLQLVDEVARQEDLSLPLLDVLLERFGAAEAGGHADEDLAAVFETVAGR
jgi:3-hydroxyisobutyrate dehydrogenase